MFLGTFAEKPLFSFKLALQNLSGLGKPIPSEFWQANSLSVPLGSEPAMGYLLMRREDLDGIDRNSLHSLTFKLVADATGMVPSEMTWNGLVVAREPLNLTPSNTANDPDAVYLVEVSDCVWRVKNRTFCAPINATYNIANPTSRGITGPTAYYTSSLNSGVVWTWATMVADIWGKMSAQLGTFPGLPDALTIADWDAATAYVIGDVVLRSGVEYVCTAGNTNKVPPDVAFWNVATGPQDWAFQGVCAWDALTNVLNMIGCAVRRDLTADVGSQCSIVQVGVSDDGSDETLATAETADLKIHDAEALGVVRGKIPYGVRVFFYTQKLDDDTFPRSLYSVDIIGPDSATAEPGLYHPLWDDMLAVYDNDDALINTSELAARAQDQADDYFRMVRSVGGTRLWKRYSGLVNISPGSTIKSVAWRCTKTSANEEECFTDVVRHSAQMAILLPSISPDLADRASGSTSGSTDCHAILDQCAGTVFYQRTSNGLVSNSDIPCDHCDDGSAGDPPGSGTIPTSCCADPLPSSLCCNIGPILDASGVEVTSVANMGNIRVTLNSLPNVTGGYWFGTKTLQNAFWQGSTVTVVVYCGTYPTPRLELYSIRWSLDPFLYYQAGFTEQGIASCSPFSITRTAHPYQHASDGSTNDFGWTASVTITGGACVGCSSYPTVTLQTGNIAGNSPSMTIFGTGFSTTAVANVVTFNRGATGHVTAATATTLTVVFDIHPTSTGSLTAVVTSAGCASGAAVQVATIIAPLTGIQIIGLGTNGGTTTHYDVTVATGMIGIKVTQYGPNASIAPTVTYGGAAMTQDAYGFCLSGVNATVFIFSLPCSAGSGTVAISTGSSAMQSNAVNVRGLVNNTADKVKISGATSGNPDTGASATTSTANEAVLAAFAMVQTGTGSYNWGNGFVSGGQDVDNLYTVGKCVLSEGRQILSATGTVDALITYGGSLGGIWAGAEVTYS